MIFSTSLSVAAFLHRAGGSKLDSTGSHGRGVERRVLEMSRMVEFNCTSTWLVSLVLGNDFLTVGACIIKGSGRFPPSHIPPGTSPHRQSPWSWTILPLLHVVEHFQLRLPSSSDLQYKAIYSWCTRPHMSRTILHGWHAHPGRHHVNTTIALLGRRADWCQGRESATGHSRWPARKRGTACQSDIRSSSKLSLHSSHLKTHLFKVLNSRTARSDDSSDVVRRPCSD